MPTLKLPAFVLFAAPAKPVPAVAACKDPRYASTALTYGAWGYLVKPVQLKDLLLQVNRVLTRSFRRRFGASPSCIRAEAALVRIDALD